MKKETLTFKRMALASKDGKTGVLYIHTWATGFQELIFDSHADAAKVQAKMNDVEAWKEKMNQPA